MGFLMRYVELRFPILLSILAAILTLAIKSVAYWLTDSVGLLSDALESVFNLLAALTALGALWYAAKPVDSSHPFGHEKIEFFSSGMEGVLILIAAIGIGWVAVKRLMVPQPLEEFGAGTWAALGAALIINLAAAQLLLRVGRTHGSIVLEADGKHLMTDVYTSGGVVLALALVKLTGWQIFDPLVALAVAANIVWTAVDLMVRSFHGLMDHALPKQEQELVRGAIVANLVPGTTFHALRTRKAGAHRFADFHLLVPGSWPVKKAHDLGGGIEAAIAAVLPDIEVTVHIEPIEERTSWEDSALLEVERQESSQGAAQE